MHTKQEKLESMSRLLDIMDKLRAGCPWNAAQTNETLRTMTIEEVYELSDAVMKGGTDEIKKELGDLLWHIVFYSKIAEEKDQFDFGDVAAKIGDKMVFRHPHVFPPQGEGAAEVQAAAGPKPMTAEDVSSTWELVKMKEKGGNKRILSGIPDAMPPVLKAVAMQEKARGCGFDWDKKEDVWSKVREEMGELEDAFARETKERAEEELGDYMFSLINAARLYGLDPDRALNGTCDKFRRRFTYLEEHTIREGRNLKDLSLSEMDAIWDEAKSKGM